MQEDFLFELGTEELPAKYLLSLRDALRDNLITALGKAGLSFDPNVKAFATPRRLAIFIPQLQTQQADQTLDKKGPSLDKAFDHDNKPTKACEGFAKSCGISVEQLEIRETPQGKCVFATQLMKGQATALLLPVLVEETLNKLPIAKPMRWGNQDTAFLRPVRWVLMLLGKEVIPAIFFNQTTDRLSYGHRFMANEALPIHTPSDYEKLLETKKVIADTDTRQQKIREQLHAAAKKYHGSLVENEALLHEVTGLVEWPEVLIAPFEKRFLNIPENALIAAMQVHQKSFAMRDAHQKLLPYFLTVSNIVSKDPAEVIKGNARVMHARLSDAEFFYQQDLKTPLATHLEDLKKVVFQAQLGSLHTKSVLIGKLAAQLAEACGFKTTQAEAAGQLSKCDLRTHMVGEFPELQGEMGEIYARTQKLPEEVACALAEQYLPRFANDALPESDLGICLALADRLLNLVGIFGIGQIPSGEKDPFALRRAAIGVYRILLDKKLSLSLRPQLAATEKLWREAGANFTASDVTDQVYAFVMERLRYAYAEQGVDKRVIQAVLQLQLDEIPDIDARIHAIGLFESMPESVSLAAAQKRVSNLLQKEKLLVENLPAPNPALFEAEEEKTLSNQLIEVEASTAADLKARHYVGILQKTARLKIPIDAFFDHVMVMSDDKKIRHNRLCLLAALYRFLNQVADISCLS